MEITLKDSLKQGKNVYVSYCLNADVDSIPMIFESDREAISILSNYEAAIYKFNLEEDEIYTSLIYDPFDCFR